MVVGSVQSDGPQDGLRGLAAHACTMRRVSARARVGRHCGVRDMHAQGGFQARTADCQRLITQSDLGRIEIDLLGADNVVA